MQYPFGHFFDHVRKYALTGIGLCVMIAEKQLKRLPAVIPKVLGRLQG